MKHRRHANHGRHREGTVVGQHRADEHLLGYGRHRAPPDVAERGRMAVAAALLATVGVAGASVTPNATDPDATKTIALDGADRAIPATRSIRDSGERKATTGSDSAARPASAKKAAAASGTRRPARSTTTSRSQRKTPPAPRWVNPMPQGRLTSCYGRRWGRLHAGVDLAAPSGTPIRAVGAGRVQSAGANFGGYGISVLIDHGNGYLTHYAHMSSRSVTPGERVSVGETIGREGSTGNSTGPHLHFEVHKDAWRNTVEPTDWLRDRGIDVGCD